MRDMKQKGMLADARNARKRERGHEDVKLETSSINVS